MKIRTLVALGSVAALGACSIETSDVGTVGQQDACHNPDGYYGYMAALAVAVGNELREWEATTHFYNGGWRNMAITAAAKAQCQANGHDLCGNIQAILDLQKIDYVTNPAGQRVFDGIQFYQQLSVYLERQAIWEGRTGPNGCSPGPHELELIALGAGICTLDYTFSVDMDGDPASLICKLKFAGWPENGWLNFRSTSDTVTLDPGAGMIEDEPSQNPSCQTAYLVYDPDQSEVGDACCPDGFMGGTLEVSNWSQTTLICTW